MPTPAETGRGAWSKRGNVVDSTIYKRLNGRSCSVSNVDAVTQDLWAVNRGVLAIQQLLGMDYTSGPGLFGPKTYAAVLAFQTSMVPPADGLVGRNTMRALLRGPVGALEKQRGIPRRLLWGIVGAESSWDPGAVGNTTPYDVGLAQINLKVNTTVTAEQAVTPAFALEWTAAKMAAAQATYLRSYACPVPLAWDAAALAHHAPAWGRQYASTGVLPNDKAKAYLQRVELCASVV